MNIIFIAAPAAGKGTISNRLVDDFKFNIVEAGKLLREESKKDTDTAKLIRDIQAKGYIVDDNITLSLIKEHLSKLDTTVATVWDGFPRRKNQAIIFDELVKELNLGETHVIHIKLTKEAAIRRITGRRVCPKCGRNYNIYFESLLPVIENKCDTCYVDLESRSDDNEKSYEVRYDTYEHETKPLIEHYKDTLHYSEIDGDKIPEEVYLSVKKVLGL